MSKYTLQTLVRRGPMLALLSQRASVLPGTEGNASTLTPEEETVVNEAFDVLSERLPIRMSIEEHTSLGMLGRSYFGLAYAHSMYTDFMEHGNGVVALVSGTIDSNYSGMSDVEYVMNEYLDSMDDGRMSGIWAVDTDILTENIKGDFIALIYDRSGDRLVILRGEVENNRSLFWGWHKEYGNNVLMFSDDAALLTPLCQQHKVQMFPSNHVCIVSTDIFDLLPVCHKESQSLKKKRLLSKVESANNIYIG